MEIILLGYLCTAGIIDYKRRSLSWLYLLPAFVAAVVYRVVCQENIFWQGFFGFLVGVFLFLTSLLTGNQVGKADAMIFCITGVLLGTWMNLLLLFVSLVFCSFFAAIQILRKKMKKGQEIPFLPFVFLGDICLLVLNGLGKN